MKNYGLIHAGIVADSVMVGGIDLPELLPSGDWEPYLPVFENQSKLGLETMNCVQFSRLNVCETLANFYGKPLNLSDRFLYWATGCTENGNTFSASDYGFRNRACCDESLWPWLVPMNRAEYGKEPPADVQATAKKLLDEWTIGQLRYVTPTIEGLKDALKKGPVWFCNSYHAMMIYRVDDMIRVFDTYGNGKGAFPLTYVSEIVAAYVAPFTPKTQAPMPALKLPENCFVTGVFSNGLRLALHVGGKLLIHEDKAEVFSAWVARNENPDTHRFEGGPTRTISEADWNSLPHVNFKGEPLP